MIKLKQVHVSTPCKTLSALYSCILDIIYHKVQFNVTHKIRQIGWIIYKSMLKE